MNPEPFVLDRHHGAGSPQPGGGPATLGESGGALGFAQAGAGSRIHAGGVISVRCAHGFANLPTAAEARVGEPGCLESVDRVVVGGHAFRLAQDRTVVVDAERSEVGQLPRLVIRRTLSLRCLGAEVLHPDQERAERRSCIAPGDQGRPEVAQVQGACGAGGEATGAHPAMMAPVVRGTDRDAPRDPV